MRIVAVDLRGYARQAVTLVVPFVPLVFIVMSLPEILRRMFATLL
ncbi:MAG: hypothetical protein PVH25_11430 [Burkholderiales bacterium]